MEIAPKMCVHHSHKHEHYDSHMATRIIFVQTLWRLSLKCVYTSIESSLSYRQKQARKSWEDAQAAGYARFEKVRAR